MFRAGEIMNYYGIVIGLSAFIIIGAFHPVVIKTEYYFGKKVWPAFLIIGLISLCVSIYVSTLILSSIIGVFGFSCLWSIHELIEQEERVKKGWFPKNEKRK